MKWHQCYEGWRYMRYQYGKVCLFIRFNKLPTVKGLC